MASGMDLKLSRLISGLVMAALLFCFGCASVSIETVRDKNFTGKISKMYVLINANSQLENAYFQCLKNALDAQMQSRGISSMSRINSRLELDETKFLKEIASYAPDATLLLRPTGGTKFQDGTTKNVTWDASLLNKERKRRIWRANIKDQSSAGFYKLRMDKVAETIFNNLETEGLVDKPVLQNKE